MGASTSQYSASHSAAHGAAGCVSSVAGGGKCGHGAAAAAFGKFVTVNTEGIFSDTVPGHLAHGIVATVSGCISSMLAGGEFKDGARTAAFGYLFNQMQNRGRDPNLRGDIAVGQAAEMVEERGYKILGYQVDAEISGLLSRRYDFVAESQSGSLIGFEVKSSISDAFKLNHRQVQFDAAVYEHGARTEFGIVRGVGYVGVGSGNIPKYWQSTALQNQLLLNGVTLQVITGLKVR